MEFHREIPVEFGMPIHDIGGANGALISAFHFHLTWNAEWRWNYVLGARCPRRGQLVGKWIFSLQLIFGVACVIGRKIFGKITEK
jgi:hypothetical protein